MIRIPTAAIAMAVGLTGCTDPLLPGGAQTDGAATDAPPTRGLPILAEPCALDEPGSALVVTTTDFATGSLSVVDIAARRVTRDVALASADAIPFAADDRILVVHRFGLDYLDVVRPGADGGWSSAGQHAIEIEGFAATNPHSVTVASDALAYVPLFAAARVRVLDPDAPPSTSWVRDIDLSAFSDDDNPEASLAVACGDTVFVSVQRLDPTFAVEGPDALVAIDTADGIAIDVDADRPGPQGIALQGVWLRQLRRDPTDPAGHTLLGLTTGVERIDLQTGTVTWAIPPESFAAVGSGHYLLPLSFDVDDAGQTAYVALYGADDPAVDCPTDPSRCFDQARIYAFSLTAPGTPTLVADELDAVERTLEVVGDELWFGSRRTGAAGLWVYDLTTTPPARLAGPLDTGLPPYSMTTMELP